MSHLADMPVIKPTDLRGILKYVPRFQGQIFVVALDGSIVAHENLANILLDIAVLRSLQIRVVLVHGIGQQIEELSRLRSIPISNRDGTGITDPETLDLGIRAASRVSHQILEGLTQSNLKCAITNAIRAVPLGILHGVDHRHTGKVDRIDAQFLVHLIDDGIIPIVQPIGYDRDGASLRLNSDHLATELAVRLKATKILFLHPAEGLLIHGELLREIPVETLARQLEEDRPAIPVHLQSKALHAVKAVQAGVPRVHLLNGCIPDGLLNEIFSSEGVGTLVFGNDYQQIRRAQKRDVRLIYNLTRQAVKREELLHRTLQAIEKNIDQFYVFEVDENLIACISLISYPEDPGTMEIASLYVLPFYHSRGIGRKMVEYAVQEARRREAKQVIALSTQSSTYFHRICGFTEADVNILPGIRAAQYAQSRRNSKILVRSLV